MDLNVSEHIVMLYYRDIDKAREFYGEALGLEKTMENEWVTLFRVTPRSFVGTVKEGGAGGFHKVQEYNSVMVSIATREIAGWYQHLKQWGGIEFVKDLYQATTLPMQAFLVRDPGGYTVEFFQWHEEPG
jgi:catechol 2,3-dioxygenase-like lactoylglutathione lyase family enzyme